MLVAPHVHLTTNTTVCITSLAGVLYQFFTFKKVINHFSEFLLRWFKLVLTHDKVKDTKISGKNTKAPM